MSLTKSEKHGETMGKPSYSELEDRVRALEQENLDLKQQLKELQGSEESARRQNENYGRLLKNLQEVLYILDRDGRITYISPNCGIILGYGPEEILGKKYTDFVHSKDQADRKNQLEKLVSGERASTEYRFVARDGRTVWCMTNAGPFFGEEGEVEGIYGIIIDITERKQMEEALRKSEERYRTILEAIEDGYFEVDLAGNFIFFNDAMCKILGYTREELMGMNNLEYMDGENARKVYETFNWVYRTGNPCKAFDWQLIRKNGEVCWVETSVTLIRDAGGHPGGFRGITRDVTERKTARREKQELEAQLRQAQKMEAIGTLAGGIAHDFNNILSSVIGYAELSLQEVGKESVLHTNLSRVLSAGYRARDLVKQILTLSRRGEAEFTPVPIVPLVKEALKMLRSTFPAYIEIREKILSHEMPVVIADPTQIHQVVVNLATNAKHAIGDDAGVVEISVQPVCLDEDTCRFVSNLVPGDYVKITVSDTGRGIPEKDLDKIFEPYFTTREKGLGTGLGLSIVHGIIRSHKGGLSVESQPGSGSRFHVYLPVERKEFGDEIHEKEEAWLPGGSERVLFVDDELFIVELQQKSLESLGYKVTSKISSTEALEAFMKNSHGFDIVITDMTMPEMSGPGLVSRIKKIRPDIPVVLCTGFGDGHPESKEGVDCLLVKPIGREKMAKTVRALLDGTTPPDKF
ncbi:MAG: PAS domain S-box protein [Desulfobacteraceae bacterium]|nr:PAS domain S-box protein [Desulfobacteraceae bacterium]